MPNSAFDRLVTLAAKLLGASKAFISLIDESQHWFICSYGAGPPTVEAIRASSFCAHVIETRRALVVSDAREDRRFQASPLVGREPYIRFYAGVPLMMPEGYAIGIIGVMDPEPRPSVHSGEIALLEDVAEAATAVLANHLRSVEALLRKEDEVRESRDQLRMAIAAADLGTWSADPRDGSIVLSDRAMRMLGFQAGQTVSSASILRRVHPGDRDHVTQALGRTFDPSGDGQYNLAYRTIHPDGRVRWVSAYGRAQFEGTGEKRRAIRFSGAMADVTDREERAQFLQGVMDSLIAFVAVLTPEGTVTYANRLCFEISGFAPDLAIGRHFADSPWFSYDSAVSSRIREAVAQARAGKTARFDIKAKLAGGELLDIEFAIGPIFGELEGLLVASAVDISERARYEAALRESEERFRNMAENAPVVVWVTESDKSCSYLNRQWTEITGQSIEDALGMGWLERVHPDDRIRVDARVTDANAKGIPFRLDYRLKRADGSYAWAIDSGAPRIGPNGEQLGYIGSVIDISERKAAEEALEANEERLRVMTDTMSALVWVSDKDGKAIGFNDRWYVFTGLTLEQSLGGGWMEVVYPDDLQRVQAAWSDALAGGKAYEMELRYRRHDGTYRWFLVRAEPVLNAVGMILEWIGTSTDVHELRTTHEALQRAFAEKDLLLREVHHRVKNNLQAIWALIQLEAIRLKDIPEGRDRLEAIGERLDAMGRLHRHIYQSADLTRVALQPYLKQLALGLVDLHGQVGRVSTEIAAEPLECGIDTAFPLGLIANEVITNSLKHAFPGNRLGKIRLSLWRTPSDNVELIVTDDGIGLPSDIQSVEASMTTGIVLIQSLASQLDAEWSMETGEGTTFRLVMHRAPFHATSAISD
ncbi:PAS domain S-box protein [Arenibaculum pallidiluteum]|uniref:PAS domain S-box protein n=1 Tax=Arenibaculum pallidiluteum TaxID=2812559 RepID=UPI001A963CC3|nr:PAS domain S-box protein [Arenibaculum pallidiluteum]